MAADFFNYQKAESIIRALSLIFVIWSFGTLPSIILDKNLSFKKKVVPQIFSKIGYGIVAIWLALNGFGVRSLIIGRIVYEVLSVIAIWSVVDWRPSYEFDRNISFELISYGNKVVEANIFVYLISIL